MGPNQGLPPSAKVEKWRGSLHSFGFQNKTFATRCSLMPYSKTPWGNYKLWPCINYILRQLRAIECAEWNPAEEIPLAERVSGYNPKLHQIGSLQSRNFEEYGEPLHCHYSQVHSGGMVVPIKVLSMGQIGLFNNLQRIFFY